jgi:hypothetical protein
VESKNSPTRPPARPLDARPLDTRPTAHPPARPPAHPPEIAHGNCGCRTCALQPRSERQLVEVA